MYMLPRITLLNLDHAKTMKLNLQVIDQNLILNKSYYEENQKNQYQKLNLCFLTLDIKRQMVKHIQLEITLDSDKSDHLPITNHHFFIAIGVKINDTTRNNNIQEEYRHLQGTNKSLPMPFFSGTTTALYETRVLFAFVLIFSKTLKSRLRVSFVGSAISRAQKICNQTTLEIVLLCGWTLGTNFFCN